MRDRQERPTGRRGDRFLLWAERLLLTAGTAALIWCGVLVADALIAQRIARRSLEALAGADARVSSAVLAETDHSPREPAPVRGAAVGALSIPRVNLSAVVLHGSDEQTLRRGPGHLENTAWPGEPGNVVIAGHRDSFFRPLRHIARGDDIFLDTPGGQFHYRVISLTVVNPRDVSVLAPTNENMLTLITCFPFWVFGNAPDRFVVRAAAVVTGIDAAPAGRPVHEAAAAQTPALEEPAAVARLPVTAPAVVDDQVLVRRAVERFRAAYNSRLAAEGLAADARLNFASCEVALGSDTATVTCLASGDASPDVRTFSLDHTAGGWAITEIIVK